jgi:hypothetical protein
LFNIEKPELVYLFDSITVFTESIKKEMISSSQIEEIASCASLIMLSGAEIIESFV